MTADGYRIPFSGEENILTLILVMVTQLCDYPQTTFKLLNEFYYIYRCIAIITTKFYSIYISSSCPLSSSLSFLF